MSRILCILLAAVACLAAPVFPQGGAPAAIAYTEPKKGGGVALKVMNADGTGQRTVLASVHGFTSPVLSPDGREIAFGQTIQGQRGIFVIGSDGAGLRFVAAVHHTLVMVESIRPSWSPVPAPDGHYKIVFDVEDPVDQSWDIAVVNPDGTGYQQLTHADAGYSYYDWTWDGSRIVAVDLDRPRELLVFQLGAVAGGGLEVTGTTVLDLAGTPLQGASVSHHFACANTADVVTVAAVPPGGSNRDLWLVPLAAPNLALRLTTNTRDDIYPTFTPDDRRIVYWNTRDGIRSVNADGTGNVLLNAKGRHPSARRR